MRFLGSCALLMITLQSQAMVVNTNDADWWRDGAKAPWSFGILDEDGNGQVSPSELAKAQDDYLKALKETRASLVSAVDKDDSGKLSRYEAQETRPRFNSLLTRAKEMALAIHDADHDGKLSDSERKRLMDVVIQVFIKHNTVRVDTNKDSRVTPEEGHKAIDSIIAGKGGLFTLCDRNNDGQVSPQETLLAFDLLSVFAGIRPVF